MAVKGVDISGPIRVSVAQLRAAGIQFVICKTGFGSDYPGQQDSGIEQNLRLLEAGGMPYGVYHFSYARDRAGGVAEAKHCLRMLGGRKPLYGVWFDMEANSTLGGDLAGAAQGFCDTMEAAGLYVGVYASTSWWQDYLTDPAFAQWDKWVAQYHTECQYQGEYGIWQYTNKMVIAGQTFDGNWAYKDYPSIIRGMTSGEDTKEEPELTEAQVRKIAREELQAYQNELAKKPASDGWGEKAQAWAVEQGVIQGDPDGNLRPRSHITREEAEQMLKNYHENATR